MKKNDISSADQDRMLRLRIQSELPQAGRDEWFTRKVMNRLPEKQPSSVSWIEKLGFLLAGVVLVILWMLFGRNVIASGAVTVVDIIIYGSFLAIAASLVVGMLRPFRS